MGWDLLGGGSADLEAMVLMTGFYVSWDVAKLI